MNKSTQISAKNITNINDVVIGFNMQTVNDYQNKANSIYDMMITDFEQLEVGVDVEVNSSSKYWEAEALGVNEYEGDLIYFFHKDHLGSSTQISDISANIIHHIEYMPYGETFVEQRSNWGTNYKFNGKELDEETGFYYYGARYYNPDISIWLSVDPLSDKYPSLSPYNYCANNPIKYVDPDGRSFGHYVDGNGNTIGSDGKTDNNHYLVVNKNDIEMIANNKSNNLPTCNSELKGDYFLLPTYEERQEFIKGVFNPASLDQSRENGMHSTNTSNPDVFGYVYYTPGPEFKLIGGVVTGSVNSKDVSSRKNVENDNWLRHQAHSHNFKTSDFFGFEEFFRQKPPSGSPNGRAKFGGDTWAIQNFISGTAFDIENNIAYIYKQNQKEYGKMPINAYSKKFENE